MNKTWQNCGEIEVGFKNTHSLCDDLCDKNNIMWHKMQVLRCPDCGKMVREYPQNTVSLHCCPCCGVKLELGKE